MYQSYFNLKYNYNCVFSGCPMRPNFEKKAYRSFLNLFDMYSSTDKHVKSYLLGSLWVECLLSISLFFPLLNPPVGFNLTRLADASLLDPTAESATIDDVPGFSAAFSDDPAVVKYFFDKSVSNNESTKVFVFVSRNTSKSLMQRSRDGWSSSTFFARATMYSANFSGSPSNLKKLNYFFVGKKSNWMINCIKISHCSL